MSVQRKVSKLDAVLDDANQAAKLGIHSEAIKLYRRVLKERPSHVEANAGLGLCLKALGQFAEAEQPLKRAATLAPNSAQAQCDAGVVLRFLNKLDEAEAALRRALALNPNLPDALNNMGLTIAAQGKLADSFPWFKRYADLAYGPPWAARPMGAVPAHKVQHDQEQRSYVAGLPVSHQTDLGARLGGRAVGNSTRDSIADLWQSTTPQYVVIDNFLTPEALDAIRRFCWASPFWHGFHADGYVRAQPEHGFVCPLLAQIDQELHETYPTIMGELPLLYWWGFKYDGSKRGTGIHADFAAVNINLWIAPDEANLDPDSGGLVIWDKPAPLDWGFAQYNGPTHLAREYLAKSGARSITVPHRANRAVVFNSNLFHETDKIHFKDGYQNRRINITMLYGWRGEGAART